MQAAALDAGGAGTGSPAASNAARLAISAHERRLIMESAQKNGNNNKLWESATSRLANVNHRYSSSDNIDGNALEIDLHDLWFLYYHTAKTVSRDSPMLDRLVLQILQAREQGALSRRRRRLADDDSAGTTTATATTSDGVIWADLPFLVSDMAGFWSSDWAAMSAESRLSFATFLAKLASVGACSDRLSSIGIVLLRDALETPRPLGKLEDQKQSPEDPARLPGEVTVAALLPAVNAWLFHAGDKMIQLADEHTATTTASAAADNANFGELFRNDPLSHEVSGAFSPGRWIFWLKRLEQVSDAATGVGEDSLARFAQRLMDNMILVAEQTDSAVRRTLEALPPGSIRHQPMMIELGSKTTN